MFSLMLSVLVQQCSNYYFITSILINLAQFIPANLIVVELGIFMVINTLQNQVKVKINKVILSKVIVNKP